MVNYEAVVIEANTELTQSGRELLYAIYPVDGLAIADLPLAYVDHGDKQKEDTFLALQQHLLSEDVQRQLLQRGASCHVGGHSIGRCRYIGLQAGLGH
ncbi:MAG: hypothetical protein U0703_11770 [Anaerolineae bacterium]